MSHVNQYCSKSLVELSISGIESESWLSFYQPFGNVKRLAIELKNSCNWRQGFLKRFFPNIENLKILNFSTWITNFKCIENRFPKLEHLEVGQKGLAIANIRKENLYYALLSNPQLKRFTLHCDFDTKFFHTIEDFLWRLEANISSKHLDFFGHDNLAEIFNKMKDIERFCKCPLKNNHFYEVADDIQDEHSMLNSDPHVLSTRF